MGERLMKRGEKAFRIVLVLLHCLLCLGALAAPAWAAEAGPQSEKNAQTLEQLGLLQGDKLGYSLERQSTRLEGLVLFTRLTGEESKAQAYTSYTHPFSDVAAWGMGYVENAYVNGVAKGMTATSFGAKNNLTAPPYVTFLLRALGYEEEKGDFTWRDSLGKAKEIGLLTAAQYDNLQQNPLLRGDIVDISYQALSQKQKGKQQTLLEQLVATGAVSREQAEQAGFKLSTAADSKDEKDNKDNKNNKNDEDTGVSQSGVNKTLAVPHYLQADERWKQLELTPGVTLEQAGCAYTCVVMVTSFMEDDPGIDPNTFFDSSYFTGANIIWSKVGFETRDNPAETSELWLTIFRELKAGRPVILMASRSYGSHFVVINGYQNVELNAKGVPLNLQPENFTVLDPGGFCQDLAVFFEIYPALGQGRFYIK